MCTTDLPLARDDQSEPEAYVIQSSEALRHTRIGSRDAANVEKRCVADAEQPPRVEIREEPLLDRQQRAPLSGLVTQRVTAQAVVAAEQNLRLAVEVARRCEGQVAAKSRVSELRA